MNPSAMKKAEIARVLSVVPLHSLDKIKEYIETFIAESETAKLRNRSLKGIWKNKGFENIADPDTELKAVRKEMEDSILRRKF